MKYVGPENAVNVAVGTMFAMHEEWVRVLGGRSPNADDVRRLVPGQHFRPIVNKSNAPRPGIEMTLEPRGVREAASHAQVVRTIRL